MVGASARRIAKPHDLPIYSSGNKSVRTALTVAQSTITGERFILISISASIAFDSEELGGSGARSAAAAMVLSSPVAAEEAFFALLLMLLLLLAPAEGMSPAAPERFFPFLPDNLERIFFLLSEPCNNE